MFLIDLLEQKSRGIAMEATSHSCLSLSLLCNAVSLFSCTDITDEEVRMLKQHCLSFYRGYCFFFAVNPSVWTLGHVVPLHTKEKKGKYGMGLGLNSMEGREAKHIAISRYSHNTTYLYRWEQIFRHEYISIIWLREKGYNTNIAVSSSRKL